MRKGVDDNRGKERRQRPAGERQGDRPKGKWAGRPHRPASKRSADAAAAPARPAAPQKGVERIAKVIARAGLASRREAEAWIAAGRVAINGEAIASPARDVAAADRITVDGKPLPARERTRLFLYHKPRGLVTTHADPEGRPTLFSTLPADLPRLISVGRLDIGTEGLLLLTNDGGLARVLELPQTGWLRRYRVRANGKVTQAALDALRDGVTIEGIHYGAIEAAVEREQGANVWLSFAIREGKNREVKNVLGHLGLAVNRLIRVSFGPFQLRDLAEGAIEEVKTKVLREQLGERLVALAGADFSAPTIARDAPRPAAPRPQRDAQRREDSPADPRSKRHEHAGGRFERRPERTMPNRRSNEEPPHRERPPHENARSARPRFEDRRTRPHRGDRPERDADAPRKPRPKPRAGFEGRAWRARPEAGEAPPLRAADTASDRKGRRFKVVSKAAKAAARDAERLGAPEIARRQGKRGKRPWHGKRKD